MKFDSNLDDSENFIRWREENQRRIETGERTRYSALSAAEKQQLLVINEHLGKIERRYRPEAVETSRKLDARVVNPTDWLRDYEIELEITYCLREDDPEYAKDDDNILMQQTEPMGHCAAPERVAQEEEFLKYNWADPAERDEGEHHCRLYHDLYDHQSLDWRDLLRIGAIWVDFKVICQEHIEFAETR